MPIRPSGPVPNRVMIVGEAPGEKDEQVGLPFLGGSGNELRRMLTQAGFEQSKLYYTNVFMTRPPNNDINRYCGKRAEVSKSYPLPALAAGKYVLESHLHELGRLREEIEKVKPDLIIALGNVAAWALIQRTGISKIRGSIFPNELLPDGPPVLPTYHPSAVLRQWDLRVIVVHDLIKAKRYLDEGFHPPRRELWINPTIAEVHEFVERYILISDGPRPTLLSFDVETMGGSVTCIGFAPSENLALTIPFYDPKAEDKNFWPTLELELEAYGIVKKVLESSIPKLGQNGLYDIQYCRAWGINVMNYAHDTMIRHHALYPELEKSLGFMGTIYTDESPWKLIRNRAKENFKADDE